jgi:hypothetical protein
MQKNNHNIVFFLNKNAIFFLRNMSKIAENCDHNIDPGWVLFLKSPKSVAQTHFGQNLWHPLHSRKT